MDSFVLLLKELFAHNPALIKLRQQIQQQRLQAWLAGGCLRDLLLNRPPDDIDITTVEDPSSLAQDWARQSGGHWFWLDADRLQSRVVLPNRLMVDFSPLRAATIVGDLNLRDFTINALAVSLTEDFTNCQLIDPLNGQKDLADNLLSFCSSRSISDDPLRMLKGIRHAATLRFDLSDQARMQIESEAATLACVAGERIRDELGKILNGELPGYGLEMLYQTGLLQPLFGLPADSWKPLESFAEIRKLDLLIKENALLRTGQQAELFGAHALFLLATFLRDYSNGGLESLLHEGLRLSRRQQRLIICLQSEPNPTWYDHLALVSTVRQKALLAEQLGAFPVEQLYYWALVGQKLSLDQAGEFIAAFSQMQKEERIPDLVDGHQLGDLLQLSGKQTGAWLQRIKQAEIDGEISSREDVPVWLQGKISD